MKRDTAETLILAACTAVLGLCLGLALGIYAGQATCGKPATQTIPPTKPAKVIT